MKVFIAVSKKQDLFGKNLGQMMLEAAYECVPAMGATKEEVTRYLSDKRGKSKMKVISVEIEDVDMIRIAQHFLGGIHGVHTYVEDLKTVDFKFTVEPKPKTPVVKKRPQSHGRIIKSEVINGYDKALTVLHGPDEDFSRVYFISNEGISRHEDRKNLDDCLRGVKLFSVDSMFYMKSKAVRTCQQMLGWIDLSDKDREFVEDKIGGS